MSLSSFFAAARHPVWWGGRRGWGVMLRRLLRLGLGALLLAWVAALVAWLTLQWLILPRLDDWRPRIEAQASRALGQPVQIGRIAVHSAGWVPAFVLQDVVLRDARGREALRLPQVSAALSVPSLLALRLRFEQLLIEDARLDIRRDAAGRWHVAGLDVAANGAALDSDASADWLFEQHEIVVRGGVLRWVDEQRNAPPLRVTDVLLVLRNQGRRHALRLDATPPPDWGQRFSLRALAQAPLLGRAGDWQRWTGTLFADLPRADLAQLRRHVTLPVDLQQGEAALRAWVDWDQGLPRTLTLDAALRDVSVRLAEGLEPLAFDHLSARFVAERSAAGVKLAVTGLTLKVAGGPSWATSALAVSWRQTQAMTLAAADARHPVTGGEFRADRLDLGTLAELGERLPIGAGLRSLLRQLKPEGTVQPVQASWAGALGAPSDYLVKASVRGLAIAAAPSPEPGGIGRPGWQGADLEITADASGGQAELRLSDGALDLPGVFEQAVVPLTHLSTQLQWRIEPTRPAVSGDAAPRIELKVVNARFDNDDARGTLNASWHSGTGSGFGKGGRLPGVLALSGSLSEGRAAQVARYLPLGIGAETRKWVRQAVQAGELRDVSYRVKGDLWDFPYVNRRDGEFRIAGKVQGVTLLPVPGMPEDTLAAVGGSTLTGAAAVGASAWPAFTAISGELVFERDAIQFQGARGRLWGVELAEVQGRIRELSDHALLEIEGQARGPLSDLLRYVNTTPLAGWTGDGLAQTSASGPAELKLALNIPLARAADTQVKASVQLLGNDLRLRPDLPPLPNARGRIEATQKGVQVSALRSQLAGGELQIDGGTQPDGSQRFTLAGSASADGLRRLAEGGSAARWAQRLQGQTAYRAQLSLQHGQTEWQLASNLVGMAIDLPAPLHKAAGANLALRVGSTWQAEPRAAAPADPGAAALREWLRLELGPLQASVVLDHSQPELRVARSAVAFNSPLPDPAVGGRAVLTLPRLDLDAWQALLGSAPAPGMASVAAAANGPASTAASARPAAAVETPWLPRSVQLKTAELLAGGRRLSGVSLDLQRLGMPGEISANGGVAPNGESGWRVQGTADQAAGSIEVLEPRGANSAGRIKARLSRLSLPPADADAMPESVADLLEQAPASVPALDIEVEDFELRGHKLGRLVVEAVNHAPSEPRARGEWRLTRLQLANPDARLTATGRWQAGVARRQMTLDFTLDIVNGGALLQRFGLGPVLKGVRGQMKGRLGWDGSPLDFDVPSLGGTLGLALAGGQFLKVDAGAARLLGVLSLQALPRRLLLDFRDVFQQGFAFDNITGDVRISRGVASTDNLRLRGVQAVVLMDGSADIARETQDLQVVVMPELNTASASLAYAAINPAIALGAFLGQWLLSEPLRQVSAREFHITGPWDDPKVERVERRLLDPLPPLAAAETAQSSQSAVDAAAAAASAAATAAAAATVPASKP
jgi:uncharacterized protein (TIGR02099 family)